MARLDLFQRTNALFIVIILFILMILCIVAGAALKRHRNAGGEVQDNPANSIIYGAVFGLMAFLLGFTFSMGGTRFNERRQASIVEANAISTAAFRIKLYPDSEQVVLRRLFKQYLQTRIDNFEADADIERILAAEKRRENVTHQLWQEVTDYSKKNSSVIISGQMLPAVNIMFDAATSSTYSELLRVPTSIVLMLFSFSLICAFFVGYLSVGKGRFDWFTGIGFCVLISVVFFTTLDLDRPRRGLIKLDASRQAIISQMKNL